MIKIRPIYDNYLEKRQEAEIYGAYVCMCVCMCVHVLHYVECKQALNIVTAQYKAMLHIVATDSLGYLKS